jgi:hypothetical protein
VTEFGNLSAAPEDTRRRSPLRRDASPWIDRLDEMGTTFALLRDLWTHVGPGLLLALALPVLAGILGVILLQGYKRVRDRREAATDSA